MNTPALLPLSRITWMCVFYSISQSFPVGLNSSCPLKVAGLIMCLYWLPYFLHLICPWISQINYVYSVLISGSASQGNPTNIHPYWNNSPSLTFIWKGNTSQKWGVLQINISWSFVFFFFKSECSFLLNAYRDDFRIINPSLAQCLPHFPVLCSVCSVGGIQVQNKLLGTIPSPQTEHGDCGISQDTLG